MAALYYISGMAGNSFGDIFRITSFGESHGVAMGVVIDGCPAGLTISAEDIQRDLDRRRPGQSKITTQRKESDMVEVLSGVFEGKIMGTPIALLIKNEDAKSKDYSHLKDTYRPSHADYTYQAKYGARDYRGGGRSSARETVARVAAGAVARKLLAAHGMVITAFVSAVGTIQLGAAYQQLDFGKIDDNLVRCPDEQTANTMIAAIETAKKAGDTLGGVVTCVVTGTPAGLGEPVFDRLEADLAKAMLSINATKGFEIGSGFQGATMKGSEHNDLFEMTDGKVNTSTNYSGGVQGGISNGADIYFKVAFKPVATIMQNQQSVNTEGEAVVVAGKGRHDPCVVPRAVPIVEAMCALVLADALLKQRSSQL